MRNTLQHTATHCNTLQHTATHCNSMQLNATHSTQHTHEYIVTYIQSAGTTQAPPQAHARFMMQLTATRYNIVHERSCRHKCGQLTCTECIRIPTATHCNTLQTIATNCNSLQLTATHCNTLQHTATHCNTLQRTATHCNALQHTATHCNIELEQSHRHKCM